MKTTFVYVFLFLCLNNIEGQEYHNIKGSIVSNITSTPVQYANIFFNKKTGTSSDKEGKFNLQYTSKQLSDTLTISALGFKTLKLPLSFLLNSPNLKLEEDIYSLDEVVITPLSAYPILKKSASKAYKNYKIDWTSADIEVSQFIFFEPKETTEQMYVASAKTNVTMNYKNKVSQVKFRVNNHLETSNFKEYDNLSTIGTTKPLNLYSYFVKNEAFRKIQLINKHLGNRGAVFNSPIYKSKKISKVIDIQDLDNKPHYIISTGLANYNKKEQEKKLGYKKRNEIFNKQKKILRESLKNFPISKNKDTLDKKLNEVLSSKTPKRISNYKSYFWIDKKNFCITKYISKSEDKNSLTQRVYNKNYWAFSYVRQGNHYFINHIETLKIKYKTEKGIFYKYISFIIKNQQFDDNFIKINKKDVLPLDYTTKKSFPLKILNQVKEQERFNKIKKNVFLKQLKIKDDSIIEFYEEN